ncbi:hypothetical protein C7974DRAFT_372761 [Boeremia exigua]|uniref:uncharacterized protein n=1 Tax=Boeremia exigua TaxID=749465 RepID=UPI001E8CF78C|nr:uncharacterized protein C7974DRAFT_372761 [Boeremia exigua]KAH6642907.1 hypothetical protein C7974DRAFT_372761 [Boeremia exigua]
MWTPFPGVGSSVSWDAKPHWRVRWGCVVPTSSLVFYHQKDSTMSGSCDASVDVFSDGIYDQRFFQESSVRDWRQSSLTPCFSPSEASHWNSGDRLVSPAYEPAMQQNRTLGIHIPEGKTQEMSGSRLEYLDSPFEVSHAYPTWLPESASSGLQSSFWEFDSSAGYSLPYQETEHLSDTSGIGAFAHNLCSPADDLLDDLSPVSTTSDGFYMGHPYAASYEPYEMTIQPLEAMGREISRQDLRSTHNSTSAWSEVDTGSYCASEHQYVSPMQQRESSEYNAHIRALEVVHRSDSPGLRRKFACPQLGCAAEFKHNADLNRHLKTIHSQAGRGYRCAYEGCSKAYKVYMRLDSFKMHAAKQHGIVDVEDLVQNSRREHQGLPVSVTTPNMMFHREATRSRSRLSAASRRSRTA